MRYVVYRFFSIMCISSMLIVPQYTKAKKFSMATFTSFFGGYPYEDTIDREYYVQNPGTLTIANLEGNITIRTEWKKNTIFLKATKRANKKEHLELMNIKEDKQKTEDCDNLTLASACDKQVKGVIDYTLIVPANMQLKLKTNKGVIVVNEVNGPVRAQTVNGDIQLNNISETIHAKCEQTGSITVDHARGNVKLQTTKGNITVDDARGSIIAQTDKGKVIANCTHVPETSRIVLNTKSGPIQLALPSATNATIKGKTERGTLSSDHYLTIKTHITKLDDSAWKRFQKEVDGVIGSGEAEIRLSSGRGNIKILNVNA